MSYHPHRIPPSQQDQHHYSTYDTTPTNTLPLHHQPPYGSNPRPRQQAQSGYPLQQGNTKAELVTATRCTACGVGLVPSEFAYHSSNAFFCTTCPRPPTSTQVTLVAGKSLPKYKPSLLSGCSACWKGFKKDQMMWRCKKCWDKTLCEKCWKKTKRHCKHVSSGQVIMMRVVDGDKDDDEDNDNDYNGDDDDDVLEDVIDAIASIVI
ncbi:uncharacterized protein BKA55DRAFT_517936 [Fusarium redolens]|uniref:Uncharacterized protein n=1 Tax=Fusarium redolens TaxID=48865 RepID=A0A9P9JX36_FUSRE|nr:uncharacterized protein BKA55DRAFT_517936 [Fusarium redolens]KAH7240852.1 hypothetical protein BKA55DRAFT_517936 [Fusarium redolens]